MICDKEVDTQRLLLQETKQHPPPLFSDRDLTPRRSRISGKGVYMYKCVGVRFADLSHFTELSHENEIIWSHWDWDQIISFSWDI